MPLVIFIAVMVIDSKPCDQSIDKSRTHCAVRGVYFRREKQEI